MILIHKNKIVFEAYKRGCDALVVAPYFFFSLNYFLIKFWIYVAQSKNEKDENGEVKVFTVESNYVIDSKPNLELNDKFCIKDASHSETSI